MLGHNKHRLIMAYYTSYWRHCQDGELPQIKSYFVKYRCLKKSVTFPSVN
jgi:hypothetical protein